MKRSLRIGITIGLRTPNESLWTNGIKQNALFLSKLFKHSPYGHDVVLLNTTNVPITSQLPWDLKYFPTRLFDEACDGLDIVIELGGQISPSQTKRIKAQGTKLISYCCGPEYVQNIEAMIFRRRLWDGIFINEHYDELWIIPQIYDLNRGFLQTLRRCPARQVPFVWDPMAMDAIGRNLPNNGEYRPTETAKRLTVIEPNIDVLKFCLYPIFIAELAYREIPDLISFLHVSNADALALEETEFSSLMRKLDIVNAHKASFIGRVITPEFLSRHTDIVISHQWGLALNYFYLECCWKGFPLIHNAEIIKDIGYYYPAHEIDLASNELVKAVKNHDINWQEYRDIQREKISRFLATNEDLARKYDNLLFEVINR